MKAELLAAHAQAQAALDAEKAIIDAMPDDVVVPPPPPSPPPPPPAPPPPPPPPAPAFIMPALPAAPVGPFTAKTSSAAISTSTVQLSKRSFANNYISLHHSNTGVHITLVDMSDIACDNVGSLWYGDLDCAVDKAVFNRIECLNVKPGRPFFRPRGPVGTFEINDCKLVWQSAANTMTGDIATAIQFGGKATGEVLDHLIINRMFVKGIHNDLPQTGYWNGDGPTTERNCRLMEVNDLTVYDVPDGGIDSKARNTIVNRLYVEDARCAIKSWDDLVATDVTSINPRVQGGIGGCSHLRLMGNATRPRVYDVKNLYAVGTAPLIRVENGPILFHGTGHFEGPKLVDKQNGGSLVAGSTWNGTVIA